MTLLFANFTSFIVGTVSSKVCILPAFGAMGVMLCRGLTMVIDGAAQTGTGGCTWKENALV